MRAASGNSTPFRKSLPETAVAVDVAADVAAAVAVAASAASSVELALELALDLSWAYSHVRTSYRLVLIDSADFARSVGRYKLTRRIADWHQRVTATATAAEAEAVVAAVPLVLYSAWATAAVGNTESHRSHSAKTVSYWRAPVPVYRTAS